MKRMISLFAAIIMVFAFANIVSAVEVKDSYTVTAKTVLYDDAKGVYNEVSVKDLAVGDTFLLAFYFDSIPADFTVFAMPIVFDSKLIKPIEVDGAIGSSDQMISKKNYWSVGFDETSFGCSASYAGAAVNTSSYSFDTEDALFYIYMEKVAESGEATVTTDGIQFADGNNQKFLPTAELSYAINLGAAAEAVKTVTKSDSKIVAEATTIDGKTTDTQIGAAVGIQFTAPADVTLLPKMIWAVETSAGRKYSKAVDVNLADVAGTITVAATFHNGIHENSFGVDAVAPLLITGVDAIFTDGANDYFTNADDAAKKTTVSAE